MPKKSNKLSSDIIAHWPEVFKDVEVKAIPLDYLESINVEFADGKVWIIDLKDPRKNSVNNLAEVIDELLNEYEDNIVNIDFRVDVVKIKTDITRRTHIFMKKRK